MYRGVLEKCSGDIVPAVCYTIYTIYLSRWSLTADPISSEPFSYFFIESNTFINIFLAVDNFVQIYWKTIISHERIRRAINDLSSNIIPTKQKVIFF